MSCLFYTSAFSLVSDDPIGSDTFIHGTDRVRIGELYADDLNGTFHFHLGYPIYILIYSLPTDMGQNTATIKYAIGSTFGNAFPMYLFGSGILTLFQFAKGLLQTHTVAGALEIAITYYFSKLTPFPLNEFLTASGFREVAVNITIALGLGVVLASYRYRKNRY